MLGRSTGKQSKPTGWVQKKLANGEVFAGRKPRTPRLPTGAKVSRYKTSIVLAGTLSMNVSDRAERQDVPTGARV